MAKRTSNSSVNSSIRQQTSANTEGFSQILAVQSASLGELTSIKQLMELSNKVQSATAAKMGGGIVTDTVILSKIRDTLAEQLKTTRKMQKSDEDFQKEWDKEAKAITEIAKGMTTFKTLGEKLKDKKEDLKQSLSVSNVKQKVMGALNIGGVFNKSMEREKFIEKQRALGNPATREQLKKDYEGAHNAAKEIKKNEAAIEKFKAVTGHSEEEMGKSQAGRALLEKRQAHADEYAKYDYATDVKSPTPVNRALVSNLQANTAGLKPPTATAAAADKGKSEETELENNRMMSSQTDLLEKIEENTRGDSAPIKAKAASGDGGGFGGGIMAGIGAGLKALGGGISGLGKGIGSGIQGLLTGIAKGIGAFGDSKVLKGAASMVVLAGALWVTGKALQEFADVEWESLAKGGVALLGLAGIAMLLGKSSASMLLGSAALVVLSGALWITGDAMQKFQGLDWETIGKGMAAVVGLGVIGAVAGTAAPLIAAGAVSLGLMGGALWLIGEAMQAVGKGFSDMTDGLERIGKMDGSNLLQVAAGVAALGVAMAAFGAGQAVAGIGNLIGRFLTIGTDSPVEQLIKIGQNGEGVMKAAQGLEKLSGAMVQFGKIPKDGMAAVNDFPWLKATAFVAAGGAMQVDGTKVANASKMNADQSAAVKAQNATGNGRVVAVNAPVTNNSNVTQITRAPVRNPESSASNWMRSKFA
jgi:hypothetical protein